MKAIILAAGRGSRMKGFTDEIPKCLVEVHGRPLLEWQLEALRDAGIQEIGIVTGYRRDALASRGLYEFHNSRWAETNMVSSLAQAGEWLTEGPCIVSYSDIFYKASAVRALIESEARLAVTYDPDWLKLWERRFGDPLLDAETFRLGSDGVLSEIGNKPKSVDQVQGQYMGLLRIAPEGWDEIVRIRSGLTPEHCDRMHMTGTLQMVITEQRVPVTAIPYRDGWGEVDCPDDLLAY